MSNSAAVIGTPTVQTVTEDTSLQTLVAAGSISISDANAGQAAFKTTIIAASGDLGTMTIAANGAYVYSVADSKVQYLGAGQTKVDTFTVTSLDGTTKQVAFTIIGVNDTAAIGAPTVVNVTEDASSPTLTATGSISISDVDQNQAAFKTTVISASSNLGTLTLQTNGSYTYSVADSAVQFLGAGQVKTDTFTVTSLDGTTRQISFNVHGTNDAAVIGTPTMHDVTEDANNPTLTAAGSISITDADQGQAAFKTSVTSASGNLGNLVLAANGTYTYSVADSAVQYLGQGGTRVDTFTVTSLDGTTKQVSFTIHGTNDAAVIGTPTAHDLTEDATNPILYAIGTVSITDADQGEAAFQPALLAGNGNVGALIIGSNGAYIYAALDSAVQYLGAGDTRVDTFTLTALDGTTKQVTFTIHGANDAAVIGTPTVHDVTEDANPTTLTAAGTLSITDADQNQSSFQTLVTAAGGTLGHLTIAANGAYSYTVADSLVQYLGATDSKVETFTVTAFDGTTKQVSFTIHGVNDAAVIGDPTIHDVTKNASPTTLTAVGTISISDADQNQASFQASVISATGNLGHLTIAANGSYTYSVANSATQSLGAADVKVDTFTVTALDGTTKAVSFTIHGGAGANTPAVIGNPDHATVTEDVGGATLTAIGTISVTDPDAGQQAFQTTVMPGSGNLGSLNLQSTGSYTYSVADNLVQYLGLGESKVDTFTIKSVDGTSKVVSFTIQGANDAAVIGDPQIHDVTEDANVSPGGNLTASGTLLVSDADQNQSTFQPGAVAGPDNVGALTLAANGSYAYSVANSAIQALAAGEVRTDTFTVHALDGTPRVISFTVHGADDLPIAVDDTPAAITEDQVGTFTVLANDTLDVDHGAPNSVTTGTVTHLVAPSGENIDLTDTGVSVNGSNQVVVTLGSDFQHMRGGETATFDIPYTVHGDQAGDTSTATLHVTVTGVNDAPTASPVTLDPGVESTAYTITAANLLSGATDVDSPSLSITALSVSAGGGSLHDNGDQTWAYTPAAHYNGPVSFNYTVSDGSLSATSTANLALAAVATQPVITADRIEVDVSSQPIALNIHVSDADTSDTLQSIQISGIPNTQYTLNHGSPNDEGVWTVNTNDLSDLALVPVGGGAGAAGTITLHITATSVDHASTASATQPLNIQVDKPDVKFSVDGYVADALVFVDANSNGSFDSGELFTYTASDGSFSLDTSGGQVIVQGIQDADHHSRDTLTGLAFSGTLKAPTGSTVVTPLTTLIVAVAGPGGDTAAAETTVKASLGLSVSVDLTTLDPVAGTLSNAPGASAVLAASIQVQATITQLSAAISASADDVVNALAHTVTGGSTDLSNLATISTLATTLATTTLNTTLDASDLSAITAVVSASNTQIASSVSGATDLNDVSQASQVAFGSTTQALSQAATGGGGGFDQVQTDYTGDALTAKIAAAPITITGTEAADTLTGAAGDDTLLGLGGNDRLMGGTGSDHLDGGAGFDRAIYTDATGGIVVNLAAGTVSVASVDTDTLVNVEGIVGSSSADTYNAAGFTGNSGVPGTPIGYNEFEGGGGNDTVMGDVNALGAALTRVSYVSATAGVTVDIAAGTADGDASVGHDTFVGPGIQSVWGSAHDDTLLGSNNGSGTVEVFAGFAGNDIINGRGGFDRADYNQDPTTTTGITVHLAAGTVTGDASIGTDTLISVEAVRGTNFADLYDATGFSGTSANAGSLSTFNEFTGGGGNDTIIGNGNTRISFNNATAGVTVDLQTGSTPGTGTASGDASVGSDTFSGVNAVQGSMFDDTILGSNNTAATETFTGNGGNDFIDGRGGFDIASYNNIYLSTGSISVDMAAGTVTGDSSIGTDTLLSIEGIQGTGNADTYVATGYGVAGALNIGNNGNFNQFEGLAGNDTITGNGNTRVIYANAAAAVTVDLSLGTAHGTAAGDAAAIGIDIITGGVNSITGSAFGDTLTGDGNSNTFVGGGGNDTIDGGGSGDIAIFTGSRGQYTLTFNTPGAGTVADTVANRDGTDTLTNVEILQFSNTNVLTASGSSGSPVDLSDNRLFFNAATNPLTTLTGSADDFIKISQSLSGHQIDLGAGSNDTVILGVTGNYTLNLANVEHLVGTGGNDSVSLAANTNGLTIDMGGGNDSISLANGTNSLSITGDEILTGSDFAVGSISNDTLTLLSDVSGLSVNLANGINTLNLTAGANSFTNIFNVDTVNGTASDDTLTVANGLSSPNNDQSVDLGGGNDTLQMGATFLSVALHNVEHLVGSAGGDFYSLTNDQNGLTVDLGAGNNSLQIAAGANTLSVTNVQNVGTTDFFNGSPASDDTLTLLNDVSGITVNLQEGNNTLNLAAGTNSLTAFNVQHINGSASDDVLTMLNDAGGDIIDLGAGNDTLNLTVFTGGVTVANVEHVIGSANTDFITIANAAGTTTVTGGGSGDFITASAATDVIRYTDASESSAATGEDTVTNFDAAHDSFLLDGVAGLAGSVHFMASGVLDGSLATPRAEAILTNSGGQTLLQIDVNGDGTIGAGDITVIMNNLTGTLSDANFAVITPNHAPTDIMLSGTIVPENSAPGSVVGLFSDMDPDAGDGATYAFTSNPGALFAIVNGNQLVTTAPLDYEATASHQVGILVTDAAGATFSKNFQIDVTNVNEAPTGISLTNASIAENAPGFTVVGSLSAIDPDAGDTATYTLVNDAGGLFSLAANLLMTTVPLDFEQAASHQITVRATDAGGLTVDRTFTIATTNVNEAPTAVALSNASIAENSAANTVVGALSAIDPDAGDTATFTLVSDAGGLFSILNGNLVATAPLNYEQATSHSVTVRATDAGGLTHDTTFAIATTNVNEAPTDISLSNTVIPQGTANGTVVGALSALDPDAGDSFTYTLADNAGGQFAVSGGNIVVAGSLTTGTEQITVVATDAGGLSFQKTIGITVNGGALVVGTAGPDTLPGTTSDDTIQGLGGNDKLQGLAGNDILDGGQGFDRALYTDATSGITVNLAAGTVTGGSGSDTLINVESIVGSDFADTINTAGFTGDSGIAGNPFGLNEIEGRGGNDTITSDVNSQGALLTRVSYISATAGVTVDLAAHTASASDGSVGTDNLVGSGFSTVIGSQFADTLLGTANANGTVEIFDGRAGNDTINGRGGFDRADYALDPATNSGITVNLLAGTVVGDRQGTGDVTIGSDTLISVESVRGTNFADSFNAVGFSGSGVNPGSNGTFNEFNGMGGTDTITGNGNTRLAFVNATGSITVDLLAGTDSGDASTGNDTFTGVNAVQASMFDDTILGSNSTTTTETFAGLGGNDFIDGRGGFDLATYNNIYFSTGAITVNMGAGTVTGDASVGTDTLRSIEAVQGTNFNDVFDASTFGTAGALNIGNNGTFNQFEGIGGNDTITGNGNTRIIYSSAAAGVTIHLTAGTATGDASVGSDSFTAVNSATGSAFADTYDASGFVGGVGAFNSGSFNLFEGIGGNDTITGNGNTRIAYTQAASAVSVDLSTGNAHSIAASDGAGIGIDTILGGVNSVQGSNFNDVISGGSGNEFFFGGTGNDTLNGGGGSDTLTGQGSNDALDGGTGTDMASFTGNRAQYTVSTNGTTGVTTVTDNVGGRDGIDTLTNVEVLQFSDATVLLTAGTALNPVDISAFNLGPGTIAGTGADDFLAVGGNVFGHLIDLGAGSNDTVSLAAPNFYQLNLANVEHVTGSTGNDNVNLVVGAAGLTVDLGGGSDDLTLAGGVNSLSVANVEILTTNDFTGPAVDDTLTLLNDVTGGMNVNLAQGNNILNLAAGSNSFVDLFNIGHVNGTASDDVLTITDGIFTLDNNPVIDLGGGDNTLNFGGIGFSMTALNVQHVVGNALDNNVTFNNDLTAVSIDLGTGIDHVNLASGANSVSLTGVDSVSGSDFSGPASDDVLTLLNDVSGLTIDLGPGTNSVNLAAGSNSVDNLFNINQVTGSGSDDVLTVTQQSFATIFDMGAGNDTISFGGQANGVTVVNAETVNGSGGNDVFTIGNTSGSTTITGGLGSDAITAGSAPVTFNFAAAAQSQTGNGDTIFNFNANQDNFQFTNMTGPNGFTGPVHFVDTAAFGGSVATPQSEARVDVTGPNATLQIDVNGDGVMGANDIEIHLTNYTGTLQDSNFLLHP
jgi:VCBS repeat-containing protein